MKRLTCLHLIGLLFVSPTPTVRADIFQWAYINPAVPSQGKQQSTTLCVDGAGLNAVPGAILSYPLFACKSVDGVSHRRGPKGRQWSLRQSD